MAAIGEVQLVQGTVRSHGGAGSFAGHRILFTYATSGDGADGAPDVVEAAATAELDPSGTFSLDLPARDSLAGPVEAAVLAPSGLVIAREDFAPKRLARPLVIEATPAEPVE